MLITNKRKLSKQSPKPSSQQRADQRAYEKLRQQARRYERDLAELARK